jgi:kynurenine formamidase
MTSSDDVRGYFQELSNWGRWGEDDQLGTLNHITPAARIRGAGAVRVGRSVSCAWEVETGPAGMERSTFAVPYIAQLGDENMPGGHDHCWGVSSEVLSFGFHGGAYTHLDSPAHMFWEGKMYNGRPAELVDADGGAAWGAVTAAADGLVTRGVLLDVAALRGVDWLEDGDGVGPADLEAAEERQGVRVEPGDAVLLRTGYGRFRRETGHVWTDSGHITEAGWHASCMPWLHDRQVAYIGADTANDVQPSGIDEIFMPVHSVGLVAMGLWLLDNCDLEACAATAEELGQWSFSLAVCPIRFAGTSGSPVNPIATF